MSIDWLRSCYQSEWHLFADDATKKTKGRYYFSPPRTPFVRGQTLLGSRAWHDKNAGIVQGRGEDLATVQQWDNGALPARTPLARQVGTDACLAAGETAAGAVDAGGLVAGFVPDCFVPLPAESKDWETASAYQSCSVQLYCAWIIMRCYEWSAGRIEAWLAPFLGPAWTFSFTPSTPIFPSVAIAISADATLVWIDGTSTFQQFALQAAYALRLPDNVGGFSTSLFWYDASSYVHSKIVAAGANPAGPVFLCGHSYGGVAALLLAARYHIGQPDRRIRFLTYGSPHIGDGRLVDELRELEGVNLANDSDIVAAIPPDLVDLIAVFDFLGDVRLLTWPNWARPPLRSMMDEQGALTADAEPLLDYTIVLGFAIDVIASLPYPNVEAHTIPQYFKRIFSRCPQPEWPLTQPDYDRLFEEEFIVTELTAQIVTEAGAPWIIG